MKAEQDSQHSDIGRSADPDKRGASSSPRRNLNQWPEGSSTIASELRIHLSQNFRPLLLGAVYGFVHSRQRSEQPGRYQQHTVTLR